MTSTDSYLHRVGARILSEANDLKRTPAALADDLNVSLEMVQRVISGESDVHTAQALLLDMARYYPISLADLWIDPDDTENGALVMSESESKATSRVFDRKNGDGALTPYYEYRDTAMSTYGPYKPEWIQPLRIVENADPENPDVAYNNGHLMHQMTFFIGEVNFYWEIDGQKYCAEMNTGDSNYISPFVPHSFTSRNPEDLGIIVAVTYESELRRAIGEIGAFADTAIAEISGDLRDPSSTYQRRLEAFRQCESLSEESLADRLEQNGIPNSRSRELASGRAAPNPSETKAIAKALGVAPTDLLMEPISPGEEVIVKHWNRNEGRPYSYSNNNPYQFTELVRSAHQPMLKAFELTVLNDNPDRVEISHHLHEYVFNYGNSQVQLNWGSGNSKVLDPGASAYIQPTMTHGYSCSDGEGHLAIVRVPGRFTKAVMDEFAVYPSDHRGRAFRERVQWY